MHKFGKYKTINLTFGILPFLAGVLISLMREDSPAAQQWLSIVSLDCLIECAFLDLIAIVCGLDSPWIWECGSVPDYAEYVSRRFSILPRCFSDQHPQLL